MTYTCHICGDTVPVLELREHLAEHDQRAWDLELDDVIRAYDPNIVFPEHGLVRA